ncbi:hypothetical protein B5F40_11850 [Gordonibacter sp. An230]|nr:hypothetical protein B5F40_11850 [Gordonibacter sp. An230]
MLAHAAPPGRPRGADAPKSFGRLFEPLSNGLAQSDGRQRPRLRLRRAKAPAAAVFSSVVARQGRADAERRPAKGAACAQERARSVQKEGIRAERTPARKLQAGK